MNWLQLFGPVLKLLAPLLAKFGIYLAGHRAGSQRAIIKSKRKAEKLRKKADDIEAEIRSESGDAFRKRVFNGADPD